MEEKVFVGDKASVKGDEGLMNDKRLDAKAMKTNRIVLSSNDDKILAKGEERKKTAPKITKKDIIKMVARQSSLTRQQVEECFSTYRRILENFIKMDNIPDDLKVELPHIGYFYTIDKKGAKSGTYKMPTFYKGEDGLLRAGIQEYEIEEDLPDYKELKFKVYQSTQTSVRMISAEKTLKKQAKEGGVANG